MVILVTVCLLDSGRIEVFYGPAEENLNKNWMAYEPSEEHLSNLRVLLDQLRNRQQQDKKESDPPKWINLSTFGVLLAGTPQMAAAS